MQPCWCWVAHAGAEGSSHREGRREGWGMQAHPCKHSMPPSHQDLHLIASPAPDRGLQVPACPPLQRLPLPSCAPAPQTCTCPGQRGQCTRVAGLMPPPHADCATAKQDGQSDRRGSCARVLRPRGRVCVEGLCRQATRAKERRGSAVRSGGCAHRATHHANRTRPQGREQARGRVV